MADEVAIQFPVKSVNERSQLLGTAYFRTRSTGAASTPTTVHYKVSNLSTNETVQDWSSISAASNVSLTITGAMNQIRGGGVSERMEILVAADKGLTTESIGQYTYRIKNVYGRKD